MTVQLGRSQRRRDPFAMREFSLPQQIEIEAFLFPDRKINLRARSSGSASLYPMIEISLDFMQPVARLRPKAIPEPFSCGENLDACRQNHAAVTGRPAAVVTG
jgi:hypothetical protein